MFRYKFISGFIMLAVLLSSCATPPRLTYSNFLQIEDGMTEQEVIGILGEPTKVTSGSLDTGIGSILGLDKLSGTNMFWETEEAKADVIFFKGKVKSKNFTNQF
jgi:hypothetical protein